MKTNPFIIARKCTAGYYVLLPARTLIATWRIDIDNIDTILNVIYVSESNYIHGYKTMAGARKKIMNILTANTNNHESNN